MPAIALPIALAVSAGAGVATSIYSTKKAAQQNKDVLAAQERESRLAAHLEREERAERQRRWDDYVRVNEPYWRVGQSALRSLQELAGVPLPPPGAAMPATGSPPPPTGVPPAGVGVPSRGAVPARRTALPRGGPQAGFMPMPPGGGGMSLQDLAQLVSMSGGGVPRAPLSSQVLPQNLGVQAPAPPPRFR